MARERLESQDAWSRRVARWKRSGLTAAEFSQGEGISAGQLVWWAGRLRTLRSDVAAVPAAPVSFVELVAASPGLGVEVVLRTGAVVRVPVGFDEGTVARLVRVLDGAAP